MKSARLRQRLRLTLLDRIVRGDLRPSERIIESRLSNQLNVSRTPLREALLQLEREGFARSDVRRGFTVEPLSARDVREIYPMIWTLEGLAVNSSIDQLDLAVPDLIRINSELARTRGAERAVELDTKWHEKITSYCKNGRLTTAITGLRQAMRRYELVYMTDTRSVSKSVAQHKDIIRHIRNRAPAHLMKALEKNYRWGMDLLLRQMGDEP